MEYLEDRRASHEFHDVLSEKALRCRLAIEDEASEVPSSWRLGAGERGQRLKLSHQLLGQIRSIRLLDVYRFSSRLGERSIDGSR